MLEKKGIGDIHIHSSGGNKQFKYEFKAIKLSNFEQLKSVAVIHDADNDVKASFQRICSILKQNNVEHPQKPSSFIANSETQKIGIFIIPDGKNPGNLESLCLSTVKSETIQCIDSFMDCIRKTKDYTDPKNIHKARCQAFLSTMKKDTPSLGRAAQRGYWDFDSKKFEPLINFLKQL